MNQYNRLTALFNQMKRQKYPYKESEISKNGIYIMFENGEIHQTFDRVVRIGSHIGSNRLFKRIDEHYVDDDHRDSIFRKHLGRCFLTIDKRIDYIPTWDLKIKRVEDKAKNLSKINWSIEEVYEAKISDYIKENFSFIVIPNLYDKMIRLRLEKALIATFAQADNITISDKWIGKFHPNRKIRESGLWNIQGLGGEQLTEDEILFIEKKLE